MRGTVGQGGTKLQAAKDALTTLIDSAPSNAELGLRVFGGRVPSSDKRRGCRDTRLVFPVGRLDRARAKAALDSYDAKGFTPISRALTLAADDLPNAGERTIVLVSDGEDTCQPPSPCAVARRVARRGIDLRIETIGFQVDASTRRELRCIARVGRGSYRDATDADELGEELRAAAVRGLRAYLPRGKPVRGGTSPADAPLLPPGQYVDAIASEEERFYALPVATGQAPTAAATLVPPRGTELPGGASAIGSALRVTLIGPGPEFAELDETVEANLFFSDKRAPSIGLLGRRVGVGGQGAGGGGTSPDGGDYAKPGRHFVKVALEDDQRELTPEGGSFAMEVVVDALDAPARPPGETVPGPAAAREDGVSASAMAATGSALGLLGFVLAALLARRRRAGNG